MKFSLPFPCGRGECDDWWLGGGKGEASRRSADRWMEDVCSEGEQKEIPFQIWPHLMHAHANALIWRLCLAFIFCCGTRAWHTHTHTHTHTQAISTIMYMERTWILICLNNLLLLMRLSHLLFIKVMTWVVYWTVTQQVHNGCWKKISEQNRETPLKFKKNLYFYWVTFRNWRQMWMFMLPVGDWMSFSGASQQPWGTNSCHVLHVSLLHSQQYHPEELQLLSTDFFFWYNTTLLQVIQTVLILG